jgi:predicted N-acyltransferase
MTYSCRWLPRVAEVEAEQWNALAKPLLTPFLEWEWLHNLEISGSVTGQTGWVPHHLTLWQGKELVGIAPLYIKGHSQGEFVFDHQFAELGHRLGLQYYPKLLGMSPLTPAGGYQFIFPADFPDRARAIDLMVEEIDRFCLKNRILSCNFLYVDPYWQQEMTDRGFTPWMHHSFIWTNQNFSDFGEFLQGFNANQRRNIKRERKAVANGGIKIVPYSGEDIPHFMFGLMYDFYSVHCDKFGWWGSKYLTRKFFENLYHCFRDNVVFFAAEREGQKKPVGMSFCIRKNEQLYGRYWGCFEEIDCLHFDTCYYTPIEWAINNGVKSFDPGAGGGHKKRRGFPATPNFSLHKFYHPVLAKIIVPYMAEYNIYEQKEIDAINQELPFDLPAPKID